MDEVINDPTAAEDDRDADQDRYEQGHCILLGLFQKRYVNADILGRFRESLCRVNAVRLASNRIETSLRCRAVARNGNSKAYRDDRKQICGDRDDKMTGFGGRDRDDRKFYRDDVKKFDNDKR